MAHQFEITGLVHHFWHKRSLSFNPVKIPACKLLLVNFAVFFAADSLANCLSKIPVNGLKSEQLVYGIKCKSFQNFHRAKL